ncbi:Sulfide:quinone oxidoreductase, mitochondrial, partial [Smittium mucronatum]
SSISKAASILDNPLAGGVSRSFKVLTIGAGTGGISVTATLANKLGKGEVGVIEPSQEHYQQPLWTLVGAGIKPFSSSVRKMSDIIPERATWIKSGAVSVDPEAKRVTLANGETVSYEYLVIASGLENNLDQISGLPQALGKDGVCSNYDPNSVLLTPKFLNEFKGGEALFTMPASPIKCPGAPQKIAYLAEEKFRDNGVRDNSNVSYYSGIGKIFGIEKYANSLWEVANKRNINVNLLHDLVAIDGAKKEASFKVLDGSNEIVKKKYDFIHVTPKMSPHQYLRSSGKKLANDAGYVTVDSQTMQHVVYNNIYAIGDCSSAPTSKTAAAAVVEAFVVKSNLYDRILGRKNSSQLTYNGYTSCPLFTSKNSTIMAEFSGYTGSPIESLFYNQAKESKLSYWIVADLVPEIYWKLHVKGLWNGPSEFKPLTNPFNNN